MNRVSVNIQGIELTLKGEDSEDHLRQVGETVDEMLTAMLKANKRLNPTMATVLTCCNLVDEKLKAEKTQAEIDGKLADLADELKSKDEVIKGLEADLAQKDRDLQVLKDQQGEELAQKGEEVKKVQQEVSLLTESVREYRDDNEQLSKLNKELKFELQSYKYKVLDLQNKLFENQVTLAKDRKDLGKPGRTS